jgi:hypothetical protein
MYRVARLIPISLLCAAVVGCSPATTTFNGPHYNDSRISQSMRDSLWDYAAHIVLVSTFVDSIAIPESRIQLYYQDLINLYNSQLPVRDSIFQWYPFNLLVPDMHNIIVHGNNFRDSVSDSIIQVISKQYNLTIEDFQESRNFQRLRAAVPCNTKALADDIGQHFPNFDISPRGFGLSGGCFSELSVQNSDSYARTYTFHFCFNSLDEPHEWYVSVNDAGDVRYLGCAGFDLE